MPEYILFRFEKNEIAGSNNKIQAKVLRHKTVSFVTSSPSRWLAVLYGGATFDGNHIVSSHSLPLMLDSLPLMLVAQIRTVISVTRKCSLQTFLV